MSSDFKSAFLEAARPICHICNKEVERISHAEDFRTYESFFLIECHGDREVYYLERELIQQILFYKNGKKLAGKGYAFKKNQKLLQASE